MALLLIRHKDEDIACATYHEHDHEDEGDWHIGEDGWRIAELRIW